MKLNRMTADGQYRRFTETFDKGWATRWIAYYRIHEGKETVLAQFSGVGSGPDLPRVQHADWSDVLRREIDLAMMSGGREIPIPD